MVSLGSLWLPVLLSATFVFVASSIIHMLLGYHNRDYTPLANEDEVRAAISRGRPAVKQYVIPYANSAAEMNSEEYKRKYAEGPVAVISLKQAGPVTMGPTLVRWFVYLIVVSFFVAYIASHALEPGASYLRVFQIVGAVGFLAYAAGQLPAAIWMGKPWSVAVKEVFDGLVYGLLTAGTFGWLWPS